jgi:hypothetical protein
LASRVGHADGPLVPAQNKKKAPGRELFLLFLAVTVRFELTIQV